MSSLLSNVLHEAGWPVFPVLGFGLSALVLAIGFVRRPLDSTATLLRNLSIVTVLWGLFGTAVGLQYSIHFIEGAPADDRWLVWKGLGEALNNLSVALFLVIPTWLLYTVGKFRSRQLKEAQQGE